MLSLAGEILYKVSKMNESILDWEDRDVFLDTDFFGIQASLEIQKTNKSVTFNCIFDTPYQRRDFAAFVVDAEDPSIVTKFIPDLEDARKGDKLTVNGDVFFLESGMESDGTGFVKFGLIPAETQDDIGDIIDDDVDDGVKTGDRHGSLFSPRS